MSWWDDDGDMLGDGPADRLTEAWRAILGTRERARQPRPTMADALEAFASAMRSVPLAPASRGIALHKGNQQVGIFEGASAGADLSESFAAAIERISQEYQERFNRPARPSEVVKAMEFVLGYETGTFLSDASAWPMRDVHLSAV